VRVDKMTGEMYGYMMTSFDLMNMRDFLVRVPQWIEMNYGGSDSFKLLI